MGLYKVIADRAGHFTLTGEDAVLGVLRYPKWYAYEAEIRLADDAVYHLKQKGFWNPVMELKQGEKTLLELSMNWKGLVIQADMNGRSEKYLLHLKGMFNSRYVLTNADGQELLAVDFSMKWRKLRYDYNVSTTAGFEALRHKEVFLLAVVHGINHQLAALAAA